MQLNVLSDGVHELIVRSGDALPVREPKPLKIEGNFPTVSTFLRGRYATLKPDECHILVDRDHGVIELIISETSHFSGSVKGLLYEDADFTAFGINKAKKYTLRELSDFIKMHRYCFEDPAVAMKLVADLRNFKAKVNKDIEKVGDNRGNRNEVLSQVVDSNIPESFTLRMPIFQGGLPCTFKVEINIIVRDADMECLLESVECNDIIHDYKAISFKEQLSVITSLSPAIIIIEV